MNIRVHKVNTSVPGSYRDVKFYGLFGPYTKKIWIEGYTHCEDTIEQLNPKTLKWEKLDAIVEYNYAPTADKANGKWDFGW